MASQDNISGEPGSQPVKTTPKDALVMASILKEMGVNEYEPRVVNQMVEFAYRYITDVVEDARVYCQHANRKTLNIEDVKLSVAQKLDNSFTAPPPREFLLEIAHSKNSFPLPLITDRSGLRLPPERYCLTGNNFKVKAPSKKAQQSRKQSTTKSKAAAATTTTPPPTTTAAQQTQVQSQKQNLIAPSTVQTIETSQGTPNFSQQGMTNIQSQTTGLSSLLKRKHEDDDYDT